MRFLIFLGWCVVVVLFLSALTSTIGSIWSPTDSALAKNLSDTAWLLWILSIMSGVGMGFGTTIAIDEGKL
jgi:hypothetical protein